MRLEGKVALITGGTSGIGQATARLFCKEGAKVVIVGRRPEKGKETVDLITKDGGDILYVAGDVTKAVDVKNLVQKTVDTYGRIDILFNNAGIAERPPLDEMTEEIWDRVITINLKGVFLVTKHVAPIMKNQGGGSIINTASTMSFVGGGRGSAAYSSSKAGVLGFTRAAALELAPDNIRVNCVCPGTISPGYGRELSPDNYAARAELHPLGRLGTPEEVAYAVLFLASDESSFTTGSALFVDGGYTAR